MRRIGMSFAPILAALMLLAPASSQVARAGGQAVLEFGTMAPVTGPFVGSANPIRGVSGGGLPWAISAADGSLQSDGTLEVEVQGLVLANSAPVPPGLRGTNPVPFFKAIVSCLSINASGAATTVNVSTGNFPASSAGDSEIQATVTLPHPCIAPIIFVTSPSGSWFAATGQS